MANLQGLPALPKSLARLLNAGTEQWKEVEKIHNLRTMIQKDMTPDTSAELNNGKTADRRHSVAGTVDGALAYLRKEMVGLRQLDMSLLCQLMTLNESIQDYKQSVQMAYSDANSECGSLYSMDNGLETIRDDYESELADVDINDDMSLGDSYNSQYEPQSPRSPVPQSPGYRWPQHVKNQSATQQNNGMFKFSYGLSESNA
ncbi:unnamed protein product [Owenia fusiformis]|uniref:Uncharacterized protein n=1 Tax=Owenia fusiformis TaxID=6347 RepID=A0A8J1XXF7_OWEFU|nr:unnamed protein product [Owenia fusiformis]